MTCIRDTKAIINLDNISKNIFSIKTTLSTKTKFMAVIKANAYGHGILEVGRHLDNENIDIFGVANIQEAIHLRKNGIKKDIQVLGYTPNHQLKYGVEHNIILTVFSFEQCDLLNELSNSSYKTKIQIKLDTGFNRLGYKDFDLAFTDICKIKNLENIIIDGIFTHLALRNRDEDFMQYSNFENFINKLKENNIVYGISHICDSIAAIKYPEFHMEMIRVGAGIYGLCLEPVPYKILPSLSFNSKVTSIKDVQKGEGIGYDEDYKFDKPSKIAVLPFGYADGIPRNINKSGYVLINNKKAPYIGILCMDQCMVDITNINDVHIGTDVEVISNKLPVSYLATWCKTNKNSIVAGILPRVPRIYKRKNK